MDFLIENKNKIDQIKAVVLFILKSFPDGVDFIKLYKIMYFAQQRFLSSYGKLIFDDCFVAKKLGPVPYLTHEAILSKTKNKKPKNVEISEYLLDGIVVGENCASSTQAPNEKLISGKAKKVLEETIERYRNIESKVLSKKSHDKAYNEAEIRYQKNPEDNELSLIEIAKAGNASPAVLEYIQTKIALRNAFAV
jgi:uncharacterized phage-associated protein